MKKDKLFLIAAFMITTCLMLSCNHNGVTKFGETAFQATKESSAADNSSLLTINLALNDTYCKKTACSCVHEIAAREYEDLQAKLKSQFNIDLQIQYFIESYIMEDELAKKKFDGVICKPWTAFMLAPKYKLNYKRVADILDPFGNQWLTGLFMVRAESDIKTLADANGKTFVFGQADAYEKFYSPKAILNKEGIKPGREYDKASCLECINELVDKKADVALVSDYVMCASCAVDVAKPEDFRTIKITGKIPLTSLILDMDKISEADALRLQKALLALSGKNSPKTMLSEGFVLPAKWTPILYMK